MFDKDEVKKQGRFEQDLRFITSVANQNQNSQHGKLSLLCIKSKDAHTGWAV